MRSCHSYSSVGPINDIKVPTENLYESFSDPGLSFFQLVRTMSLRVRGFIRLAVLPGALPGQLPRRLAAARLHDEL